MFFKDEQNVYRVQTFAAWEWLRHGFGTRHSEWNGLPLSTLKQIHSDRVLVATGSPGCVGDGDALITDQPGVTVSVRTADCLPILLVEPEKRAVAAVHAGWRGTASSIAVKAVEKLTAIYGGNPQRVHAAIGPGIRVCCYQVGREVAERFLGFLPELAGGAGHAMLDLVEANRRQLISIGLEPANVYSDAPCTCCTPGEFYSYRREQTSTGRMTSIVEVITRKCHPRFLGRCL